MRWAPWMVAGIVGALVATQAEASGPRWEPNGYYLPVGVALGGAVQEDGTPGFVLGGEASFVYGDGSWLWMGPVVDAAWDFGAEALRHRVGGEIGYHAFGVELAYLGAYHDGSYLPGVDVRGVVTVAVVSLYGGYGHVFGSTRIGGFGEFGVLLKFPFELPAGPE